MKEKNFYEQKVIKKYSQIAMDIITMCTNDNDRTYFHPGTVTEYNFPITHTTETLEACKGDCTRGTTHLSIK